ncbi:MAG: amidophosphoribosyltransferase [Candidatus Aenigmatarchaeota archaeon]|nr:MAG: amidophosphoribosyltransferase [Candidatus Aenigmarchaeota archaeon]
MPGEVKDECGVAAVSLKDDTAPQLLYKLLLNMQNRGQLSTGITTYNANKSQLIDTRKDLGTVNEVFRTSLNGRTEKIFEKYRGKRGIGHVRYATSGTESKALAQPFERHHGKTWKWFSVAFNGNLANYRELRDELKKSQYCFVHDTDTEIIMYELMRGMWGKHKPELTDVFHSMTSKIDGAYNIVFINADGDIVVLRDPLGFRPLAYNITGNRVIAASESTALTNTGLLEFKDLKPGTMMTISDSDVSTHKFAESSRKAHCMFEWVYFSNVGSVIEGSPVYHVRRELGKNLAKMETEKLTDDHVVISIPSSSEPAASGYAQVVGKPKKEGLVRNRYIGRTFIEGEGKREKEVALKFTALREVLRGKKVIAIDDSIVRGNTSKLLVNFLRERGGAKEVHLRISCPPILSPCFYGIDMSTFDELIAVRHVKDIRTGITEKESESVAKEIGADSVIYQTIPNLVKSIEVPKGDLCLACLNGEYPTMCGSTMCRQAAENSRRQVKKRTCE